MDRLWFLYIVLGIVLVLLSAFFSGSETALMSINRIRFRHLAKTSRRARMVNEILEKPERLIGTLLFCNNLVNVGLSALGTGLAIALLGEQGMIYATFIITIFLLVFGEITPKTIAAYHSDAIAIMIAPLIAFFVRLLYPIVHLLSTLSRGLIFLLRLQPSRQDARLTEAEIESVIEESGDGGTLGKDQQNMLLGVLMLEKTTVSDIMLPMRDVVAIHVDADYSEVLDIVKQTEFSRYPVYKDEVTDIIGFIHVRDLIGFEPDEPFSVRKILRKPYFIPDIRPVRQQFMSFQKRRVHLAFVVDEYGNVIGLVTLEDILEEIVGEIEDEYDPLGSELQRLHDGSYCVEGKVLIRDLNRWLDLDLPEGNVRTVGGLILTELGRIPQPGDEVTIGNYRLRTLELKGKSIKKVQLWILAEQEDKEGHPTDRNDSK